MPEYLNLSEKAPVLWKAPAGGGNQHCVDQIVMCS